MRGAVAAGHPLTAEAGARVLAEGGNAVDACVAAAFVAGVAESPLTGLGAGGFMLVHGADGANALLDFFVAVPGKGLGTPARVPLEPVDVPFGSGDTTQRFLVGPASCAVPGMLTGLGEAHRRYGTAPWKELLQPAIELARRGVELNADQALLHEILDPVLRHDPDGREAYGGRRALRLGERVVLADLGGTLERIALEGPRALYEGELARRVAGAVQERGGTITLADLASYQVVRRRPIRAAYRGGELVTNPPPSSGGILIAFALRLLDRLGAGGGPGSAAALARLADVFREATRARAGGFAAALHRGGLPDRLLADHRVEEAVREIAAREAGDPAPEPATLPSTTHVSVVDAAGNAASLSSSTGCGSGVIVPGTGIHLNNMLGERDLNPTGRLGAPGRRLTSMMAPSVLLVSGRPRYVIGSAGSERLRAAIVQTIVNAVDHGLDLAEAIERPRVHLDGDVLHLEGGIAGEEADRLERLGYHVLRWPGPGRNLFFGGVSAVGISPDGALEAAGDPRRGGHGVVVG